jgi:CRP/FNR family transcriptional regulator
MLLDDQDILMIKKHLYYLGPDLLENVINKGIPKKIPADTEILKEGQHVRVIPVVLEGLIKVYSRFEEKEILLYYIQPFESCIMSFSARLKNEPSRVFAITEDETFALLLPADDVMEWLRQFPDIHTLFYQQYNLRYAELLETIKYLLYHKLDKRIYDYLKEKSQVKGERVLNIRHKQIAQELGTAREVISRLIKKLEKEGKLRQTPDGIEILNPGD